MGFPSGFPRCQSCRMPLESVHPEVPGNCLPCGARYLASTVRVYRYDILKEQRVPKDRIRYGVDVHRATFKATFLRTESQKLPSDVPYFLPLGASTVMAVRVVILGGGEVSTDQLPEVIHV